MFNSLHSQVLTSSAFADCFFYNVQALDKDETRQLAMLGARHRERPGTVVVASPEESRGAHPRIRIAFGKGWQDFVPGDIDTVVIAGAGSSMLGTAALAKDVAERLNRPVVGVIGGPGMFGAPLDGFFSVFKYGPLSLLVEHWTTLSLLFGSTPKEDPSVVSLACGDADEDQPLAVLRELISRKSVKRVIAHSKGALVLADAVLAEKEALTKRKSKLRIGTLGAVMALPEYVACCQVLGSLDELGLLISRMSVQRNVVWGTSHWLNPKIPLALSLRDHLWEKFGSDSAFSSND
jgi:hypothetical protein